MQFSAHNIHQWKQEHDREKESQEETLGVMPGAVNNWRPARMSFPLQPHFGVCGHNDFFLTLPRGLGKDPLFRFHYFAAFFARYSSRYLRAISIMSAGITVPDIWGYTLWNMVSHCWFCSGVTSWTIKPFVFITSIAFCSPDLISDLKRTPAAAAALRSSAWSSAGILFQALSVMILAPSNGAHLMSVI